MAVGLFWSVSLQIYMREPSTKGFGERISPSIGGDSESAVWRICVLGGLPHRKSAAREGGSNPSGGARDGCWFVLECKLGDFIKKSRF